MVARTPEETGSKISVLRANKADGVRSTEIGLRDFPQPSCCETIASIHVGNRA